MIVPQKNSFFTPSPWNRKTLKLTESTGLPRDNHHVEKHWNVENVEEQVGEAEEDEEAEVASVDALVDPGAVVVEAVDALVALGAVVRGLGTRDPAREAVPVDVFLFHIFEELGERIRGSFEDSGIGEDEDPVEGGRDDPDSAEDHQDGPVDEAFRVEDSGNKGW